jgi:hypothetical protein
MKRKVRLSITRVHRQTVVSTHSGQKRQWEYSPREIECSFSNAETAESEIGLVARLIAFIGDNRLTGICKRRENRK